MFSKDKQRTAQPVREPVPAQDKKQQIAVSPSIIATGLKIIGDLSSDGEIQVDGKVEGDIRCKSLLIGIHGSVTGEVTAETVKLHGTITGQVFAKTVFFASTARMVGDVAHKSLAIEPGAFMEGHCRRMEDPRPEAATKAELMLPDGRGSATPRVAALALEEREREAAVAVR